MSYVVCMCNACVCGSCICKCYVCMCVCRKWLKKLINDKIDTWKEKFGIINNIRFSSHLSASMVLNFLNGTVSKIDSWLEITS